MKQRSYWPGMLSIYVHRVPTTRNVMPEDARHGPCHPVTTLEEKIVSTFEKLLEKIKKK